MSCTAACAADAAACAAAAVAAVAAVAAAAAVEAGAAVGAFVVVRAGVAAVVYSNTTTRNVGRMMLASLWHVMELHCTLMCSRAP